MKKLIASTAIVFAGFAGAASAMTSDADLRTIEQFAPNADVSVLTDAEVKQLISVIHSGDSASDKRSTVRAFLN